MERQVRKRGRPKKDSKMPSETPQEFFNNVLKDTKALVENIFPKLLKKTGLHKARTLSNKKFLKL